MPLCFCREREACLPRYCHGAVGTAWGAAGLLVPRCEPQAAGPQAAARAAGQGSAGHGLAQAAAWQALCRGGAGQLLPGVLGAC